MRMLLNAVAGIVLALALVFGVRAFANMVFNAKPPAQPAIEIPRIEEAKPQPKADGKGDAAQATAAAQPAAAAAPATPDPAKGKKVFNKCKACHFADKDKNKVGPHLVGIIGRPVASVEGFKYSDAMKGKAGEIGTWTKENLKAYLANPKGFVPGNKMAFGGLKKPQDIDNLLAYFESLAK